MNALPWLPALSIDMGLYKEFVSIGLKGFDESPPVETIEPYRLPGKFSSIGDRDWGSKTERAGELDKPSKPKPAMCSAGG